MVCEYILGWWNVAYYLKVYVTLTFDRTHPKQLMFHCPTLLQPGSSNTCICDYTRRWLSGTYYFQVNVTLTLTKKLLWSMFHILARITKYGVRVKSGEGGVSPAMHRSIWLWPLLCIHNIALGASVTLLWPSYSCLFSLKNWWKWMVLLIFLRFNFFYF